jgi:hypothetical protein
MGIQNVCRVDAAVKPVNKDGTSGTEVTVPYYFLGSSVYADATMSTATGIQMIPADKWDGSHPLVPVAELIEAGILDRLNVVVQSPDKKKRRYNMAVAQAKIGKLIDGTEAEQLDGKSYKLLNSSGAAVEKGTIIRVGGQTEAINP